MITYGKTIVQTALKVATKVNKLWNTFVQNIILGKFMNEGARKFVIIFLIQVIWIVD